MSVKTTGIGSIPHRNIDEALIYSFKHDIPFLPQLTSLGEKMIRQTIDDKPITEKYLALKEFKKKLIVGKISDFKVQLAGPTTCNCSADTILKNIAEFNNYFQDENLLPIVFIDEPVIKLENKNFINLLDLLKNFPNKFGLHTCANLNFSQVLSTLEKSQIEYLAFDCNFYKEKIDTKIKLIPGIPPYKKLDLKFNFEIISSSCGLANYSEEDCEKILIELNRYK